MFLTVIIQIKTKHSNNFCSLKYTVEKKKKQARDWGKIFPKHTSDKGCVPRICKELSKLIKKTHNLIKKMCNSLRR